MDDNYQQKPVKPLSSDELQKDATNAGIAPDQATQRKGDTHLPASEEGAIPDTERDLEGTEEQAAKSPPD